MHERKEKAMKKKASFKRIISLVVVLAMVITMLPEGQLIKAAIGMDINIHFYDSKKAYAGKVFLQYWQQGTATISTEEEDFVEWGVKRYPLASEEATEGEDWYGLNIKGSVEGFQFLNEDGKLNTAGSVYNGAMSKFTGDLYYMDGVWYEENPVKKADAKKFELATAKDVFYLVGDIVKPSWQIANLNYPLEKNADGSYSITLKDVEQGSYAFKVLQDPEAFNWDKAWGGKGSGGNYELTVSAQSDVTITIDPQDETHQIKAEVKAKGKVVQSPVYNADGTVTFHYVTTVTGAAIGVVGNVVSAGKKSLIKAKEYPFEEGKSVYVATSSAIKQSGLYEYSFYSLTEEGERKEALGDPLCNTVMGESPVFVRNPQVAENGLVTVYMLGEAGNGASVYYRNTASKEGQELKAGDKINLASGAAVVGYKSAKLKKDKGFTGQVYSASFYDTDEGTYSYVIVDAEGNVFADPYNFSGTNTYVQPKVDEKALAVKSPVVLEDGTTVKFMYLDKNNTAKKVSVAGQFNDWTPGKDLMKKESDGVWSIEMKNFVPGVYQYKFVVGEDGWTADENCEYLDDKDGNSILFVEGVAPETSQKAQVGVDLTLPAKAMQYTQGELKGKEVSVTYELKDKDEKDVTLKDGVLNVSDKYTKDYVEVVIKGENVSSIYKVEVVKQLYEVTIHYLASTLSADKVVKERDLWIYPEKGAGYNTGYLFNEPVFKDKLGREWATAKYSFPTNELRVIVRSKGGWTYEEASRGFKMEEGSTGGEFWILEENESDVFPQWAEKFAEAEVHWVVVEYDRPAKDYDGWNLYTWNATKKYNSISNFFTEVNGKYQTKFAIDKATTTVGYLLRSGTPQKEDWSDVTKDMDGDRAINTPTDQKVVKVKLKQGSLDAEYLPFNKGYEMNPDEKKIVFYYRDDQLFLDGTLDKLKAVKIDIAGKSYDMTYDAVNERYQYVLENAVSGDYEYCYNVTPVSGTAITAGVVSGSALADGTVSVLDNFNSRKNAAGTKSLLTFKDLTAKVTATTSVAAMNYDQNAIVNIAIDNPEAEIAAAYIDLSAIGGESKVAIDPALKAISIAVTDNTTLGEKKLPVTVVDQYNKSHKGEATINVVERVKTNDNDFDWDEAVIYFMVTDRFNDGNESNNDAYGVKDYDKNGPSSYHGGDFAGVTAKLDYLKDLGINTIWVTPVVENILDDMKATGTNGETVASYGYAGYWASNFEQLNKHLGTVEEFHTMIDEAHKRGIRIMVDVVLNHSGYGTKESPQFAGMYREKDIEGNDILGAQSGLPDFATEREDVRTKLINWQKAWVENLGKTSSGNTIDYFRIDTVKHVDPTTWSAFKNAMTTADSKFKMIGECYGAAYTDNFGNLKTGRMDSLLDFGFNDMATSMLTKGEIESVESQLEIRNTTINNTATFGSFLNSHDETGFMYSLLNMEENGKKKYTTEQAAGLTKLAASLVATAKGQPIIYYGEEIGLSGANNYPYQDNRYDMKFDNLTDSEASMLAHYKKLYSIRNKYSKIFAKGTRKQLAGSNADQYLVFERAYKEDKAVVALNLSEEEKTVTLKLEDFVGAIVKDAYQNKEYKIAKDGTVTITIPGYKAGGTVILVAEKIKTSVQATINGFTEAKKAGKSMVLYGANKAGKATTKWTFSNSNLKKVNSADFKTIKLGCEVTEASAVKEVKAILKNDKNNSNGAAITFTNTSVLPVNAKVTVDVSDLKVIKNGSKVYIYLVEGGKLKQTAVDTAKVSSEGQVTLYLAQGGTYVLLSKQAASNVRTDVKNMISVKFANTSMKKGKTTKVTVTLPTTILKKVSSFTKESMNKVQSAQLGAKISFGTSNKKVAAVNSSGKITGVKKGSATISVTIKLSDGVKRVVKKKVTVK